MTGLDQRLLAAHAAGDKAALVMLYQEAARSAAPEAAGFYLTHAYVYALELNHPDAPALRSKLKAMGREA